MNVHGLSTPCLFKYSESILMPLHRGAPRAPAGGARGQRAGIRPHGVTRTGTRIGRATLGSGKSKTHRHAHSEKIHRETYTFRISPYKQIWFRKLENLVNMVFLVEVNNRYGTNLNELCIKNTTPPRGDAGPEFLLRSKALNIFEFLFAFSSLMQTRIQICLELYFDFVYNLNNKSNDSHELQICTIRLMVQM
jgi:hypothetical protein